MVHLRIGVTRTHMDVDVHLRQGGADNVGVCLFQQLERMQGDSACGGAPAHKEQRGIGQAGDDACISDRLSWGVSSSTRS